jgi:hypothetical protein
LHFTWSQVESSDYATFIANLRGINCPEATIRDIIVADVNQVFARRRAMEIVTPRHQWWRSEPDPTIIRSAADATLALERERHDLLTRLLGPGWESSESPVAAAAGGSTLDGPLLGNLTPRVKAAIHEAERQAEQRLQTYLEERGRTGQPADPGYVARLRKEGRDSIARMLTSAQLEEYLLRYSGTATALREQLRGTELSPQEFRDLFRKLDPLEAELQLASADLSADGRRLREALEAQRQTALRESLGEERFETQQLNQDPLYTQARTIVQQAGASEESLVPLAAIMRLTEEEEERIRNDRQLTDEERLEQLQATRETQRASLKRLLGDDAFQRYLARLPILGNNPQP